MPVYFYFFILALLFIIFLMIRFFIWRRKSISTELFIKALRSENNGDFEAAQSTYKKALIEVSKIKYHGHLKNKIIEKLKVLHTLIDYNNGLRYIRQIH